MITLTRAGPWVAFPCDYWGVLYPIDAKWLQVVTGGYTWFQAVTELYGIGTMPECDKYTYYTSMQPSRTLTAITGPRYGSKTCGNLDFGLISWDSPYDPKWARSDPKNICPPKFFGFSCRVDIFVGSEHHLVQYNWSTKFGRFFPGNPLKSRGVPASLILMDVLTISTYTGLCHWPNFIPLD